MNKINLFLLSLVSVSILNAEPTKTDYRFAKLYPGAYVGSEEAERYKKTANECARNLVQKYKPKDDSLVASQTQDGTIQFLPDLGPTIEVRASSNSGTSDDGTGPVYNDPHAPTLVRSEIIGENIPINDIFANQSQRKSDLVVRGLHVLSAVITPDELRPLLDQHKDLSTKLIGANWSPEVQELVKGDFFKLIDKQTTMPKTHIADLITSHENAVSKAAFRVKLGLGVVAVAVAIGLSIKPLSKKLKEKEKKEQESQKINA